MPFTSTQVSGLVGGQQVMFSNQAAFAHQIGGLGDGPPQMMSNPYPSPSYGVAGLDPASPDIGTKIAGGTAMALPGVAAGGMMAASLLGYKSPLGLLDPFTGISRAFGAGTGGSMMARAGVMAGAEGMGLRYAAGNITGAFASGGLRAGAGVLAGGLAGAAAAALPYYIAGKAVGYGADKLYEGVQNVQDVRRMATQYFEPQYGRPDAGPGGRASVGMAKNISGLMHDLVSEDTIGSMKDMRSLMDKAGSMGMLQGVGDFTQFKEKFKGIVAKTRTVAKILGTTLEEALPLVNELGKMGMWTSRDVLGSVAAAKSVGPGGVQGLIGSMQQGAQMSYAMGGRIEAGAALGRDLFTQVAAAGRTGTFSQSDIKNFTGGVGGVEGQRMVAGTVQQVMSGFGQSAAGRLIMAGLGEMKGEQFTGRMDEEKLAKFNRGEITYDKLQQMGQQRINQSRETAASFFNKSDQLGQSMVAQGGMSTIGASIQKAMERAGYGNAGEAIQNRFIQLITGANQRQADIIQKMIQDLPRIQAEQERATEAALEDSFRQLEERRHGSFQGLKDAVGHAFEEGVGRPIQELAEGMTTTMSEAMDTLGDKIMGRTKQMPKVSADQAKLLAKSGMTSSSAQSLLDEAGLTAQSAQDFVSGGALSNMTRQFEQGSFSEIFRPLTYTGIGNRAELARTRGISLDEGANLSAVGYEMMSSGIGFHRGKKSETDIALGGGEFGEGIYAKAEDVDRARTQAVQRMDPSMQGLLGGETKEKRGAMENVKRVMKSIMHDPKTAQELMDEKERNPAGYNAKLASLVRERGGEDLVKDLRALGDKSSGKEGESLSELINIAAVAQKEMGSDTSPIAMSFARESNVIGDIRSLGVAGLQEARSKNVDAIQDILDGGVFGLEMSKENVNQLLSNKEFSSVDVAKFLRGEGGAGAEKVMKAFNAGDPAVKRLMEMTKGMDTDEKEKLADQFMRGGAMQYREHELGRDKRLKDLAGRMGSVGDVKGLDREVTSGLEEARRAFAEGEIGGGEAKLSSLARGSLSSTQIDKLLSGDAGVFGRQVGREALIQNMDFTDEKGLESFRKKMLKGGVKFDELYGPEIEKMLKSGGGFDKGEIASLKKSLLESAKQAVGEGPGGRGQSPMMEAQMKYIAANEKFVWAVSEALNGKLKGDAQDLVSSNPVSASQ